MYAIENAGIVLLATASSDEVRVWYATLSGEHFNNPDTLQVLRLQEGSAVLISTTARVLQRYIVFMCLT